MNRTLLVNLHSGPGAGKSSLAAGTFYRVKYRNINAELVQEFAKELAWEDHQGPLKDQIWMFANQLRKLNRLKGKVDVLITDSPLLLNIYYGRSHGASETLIKLVEEEHRKWETLDFFIERTKPYNPAGRWQSEAEARFIDSEIKGVLKEFNVPFKPVKGDEDAVDQIVSAIQSKLTQRKNETLDLGMPKNPDWY